MIIRSASLDDAAALAKLGSSTFAETFAYYEANGIKRAYDTEDLSQYLATAFSEEKIESELADPTFPYFLAKANKQPVAYAKLSGAQTEKYLPNSHAIELERIYISEAFIGQRIGKALMQHVKKFAKSKGYSNLWLGVWEQNARAISFYKKEGFEEFSFHYFSVGQSQVKDLLLKVHT